MDVEDPVDAAIAAWRVVHGFVMLEIVGYLDSQGQDTDQLFRDVLAQVGRGLGKPPVHP